MKKIFYLLPLLLGIFACAAQPQSNPNVADMVNATLTANAQSSPQVPFTPTLNPAPDTSITTLPADSSSAPMADDSNALWNTYRNVTYGFTFEYPAIYDDAAYKDSCGVKEIGDGIHLGHQIDLLFLNSGGLGLADFTNAFLQSKGWSVDSQNNNPINGFEAVSAQYRFGGTNRFGTLTLVKQNDQIFAFNFSAGGFCEVPADQPTEPAAYSHMIETFKLNQ